MCMLHCHALISQISRETATPLRDQFLAPGGAVTGTTKRSAASSAPDVKAKMHRDQHGAPTSMISGSGRAASSSSSAPAGEAQLQNTSEHQLEAARLRYFEALTQPNPVESGGGGGHNRGYKPPRNGISDFGLARLGVKEQFEMLIRSHGYGALPANFHHIFFTRLPPATRKYLRNVDTMFGGIVRTKKVQVSYRLGLYNYVSTNSTVGLLDFCHREIVFMLLVVEFPVCFCSLVE